jgi:epoxyqueuosine reductase
MEKVWAARAGLGWLGKNGLLINRTLGSYVTLSVMFLDRAVDRYDEPQPDGCGDCRACLSACPTEAFPEPGVVDSRRCLSYQTIENRGSVPEPLRRALAPRVFGCDVCQDVCPYNRAGGPGGDPLFAPRPLATLGAAELAALSEDEFRRLSAGMALARAQYHGLRRNALLSLGAARDRSARPVIERLCADPSEIVREAAAWALSRLT